MVKLTIDGFDIEIQNDGENIAVKVLDASGKELSNNSYMQTKEGDTETSNIETVEITDDTEDTQVQPNEQSEEQGVQTVQSQAQTVQSQAQTVQPETNESFDSYFARFMKAKK